MTMFTKGGFTHDEIYEMPVYLRKFYYSEMAKMKINMEEIPN